MKYTAISAAVLMLGLFVGCQSKPNNRYQWIVESGVLLRGDTATGKMCVSAPGDWTRNDEATRLVRSLPACATEGDRTVSASSEPIPSGVAVDCYDAKTGKKLPGMAEKYGGVTIGCGPGQISKLHSADSPAQIEVHDKANDPLGIR